MLPLLVYEGTWRHSSPLISMHLLYRSCVSVGIFLKLHATFPNSGIRARSMRRWYARVEHKELWAIIVILLTSSVLLWFGGIVGWSDPDRHYITVFMRLVLSMCFAHRWLAGVCFSNFSWTECGYARSLQRLKQHQLDKLSLCLWSPSPKHRHDLPSPAWHLDLHRSVVVVSPTISSTTIATA